MSEVVIENVEEVAVKKESPYKTDIFILKILGFVAMSIIFAALTGFSLSILFIIDFVFIFAACIYGRMIGHTPSKSSHYRSNESSASSHSGSDYRFDYGTNSNSPVHYGTISFNRSDSLNSYHGPCGAGFDVSGAYTGSDTACGGISN